MFSRRFIAITALSLIFLVATPVAEAQKGKAPSCSDIPIKVTIVESSLLSGGPYTAVDGVTAKIHICSSGTTSPTYDAQLWLGPSTRTMGLIFPSPIPGSVQNPGGPPVWVLAGRKFEAKPNLYVKNILHGHRGYDTDGDKTFTTRLMVMNIVGPNDSNVYDLRLAAPSVDALANEPLYGDMINSPQHTSSVTVQDVPGSSCRGGTGATLDSWIVAVNEPFIGTLRKQASKGKTEPHFGQYHAPMKLLIEAQRCVPSTLSIY